MGHHDPRKNQFGTIFNKSGKFLQDAFLMFSNWTCPILWESIQRSCFHLWVPLLEGPKYGVPCQRTINRYPQKHFCLTFSCSGTDETSMQLAEKNQILQKLPDLEEEKFPVYFFYTFATERMDANQLLRGTSARCGTQIFVIGLQQSICYIPGLRIQSIRRIFTYKMSKSKIFEESMKNFYLVTFFLREKISYA